MTDRPPLTTSGLEILRLHHADNSFGRICEVGARRGSWSPDDAAQVIADWGSRDVEPVSPGSGGGPKGYPREHGTPRGYYQHRSSGEKACEACLAARGKKAS